MKKRFLSIALVLCLLLTLVPTTFSAPAELDSASTWAHDGIQAAVAKGFIPADLQDNFKNVITRQEFCRMAVNWLEYAIGSPIDSILASRGLTRDPNSFSDTNDPNILAAFALGITSGVGNNQFNPGGQFNREQAATMIMNTVCALGMDVTNPAPSGFADMSKAATWAHTGINYVRAHGIMQGTGDNNFSPKGLYTREQSIITFNNIKYSIDDVVFTDEEKFHFVYSNAVSVITPPTYSVTETANGFAVQISNANDAIRALSVGDLFVLEPTSANPAGFAGRVMSTAVEGTGIVITASMPKSIDEIYDEFEFVTNMNVLTDIADLIIADEISGIGGFEITRNRTTLVNFSFKDFSYQGITINGSMTLFTPKLHANITKQHADLFVTAEAEINFKVSASTSIDKIIPLYTIPVMPVYGVLIEIPIGIRITADGQASLEVMCDMSVSAGIIRGQPSARVIIDYGINFSYNITATVSLNVQAKASLFLVPIYGIGLDLGRGFTLNDSMQAKCRADSSHDSRCFVIETFNVRKVESLSDYGLLGLLDLLQFSLDLTRNVPNTVRFRLDGAWSVFCRHEPPQPPTTLVPDIRVSSENELRQALAQAGSKPTIIGITKDIELISNFIIPNNANITLISDGFTMHSLIATRDMDAVTIGENARLTIEHIEITRTPGTSGIGIVTGGNTFIMNGGIIRGHNISSSNNTGSGVRGHFTMNGGTISGNVVGINGSVTMNGGTIHGNDRTAIESSRSLVTLSGGTINGDISVFNLMMRNTTITGNVTLVRDSGSSAMHSGTMESGTINGWLSISSSSNFTMHNGIIDGIVYLSAEILRHSTFHMINGTIKGVENYGGDFTMDGGMVTGGNSIGVINEARSMSPGAGGRHGVFIMNGGTISNHDGVGVYNGNSSYMSFSQLQTSNTFIMNGGSIIGNRGGGVVNLRAFTMNGGAINGNSTTDSGGGVTTSGTFTMTGGTIQNNTAGASGGGVSHTGGTFIFDGGWIYNNRASNGSDIQIAQTGTFNNNVLDDKIGAIGSPPPGQ